MKKQLIAAIAAATMLTSALGGLSAGASYSEYVSVYVNGTKIEDEYKPIIVNDRTLVRLVPIFEALGYDSQYDEATKSATFGMNNANASYRFTAESNEATILGTGATSENNNSSYPLDVPATLQYYDVFYVPIRAFCEMVGLDIEWNDVSRSVYIGSKPQTEIKKQLTYDEAKEIATNYVNDSDILLGGDKNLVSHNGRQAYAFVMRSKSMVENGGSGTMGMTAYVYADNGEVDVKEEVPGSELNTSNNSESSVNSNVSFGTSGKYMGGNPGKEISRVYCAAGYDINQGKSLVGEYQNNEITVEEIAQFSQKNHNTNHTDTGLMIQKALDMIKAAYGVEVTGTAVIYTNCVTAGGNTGNSEFKSFGVSYSGDGKYYVAASTANNIIENGNDTNSTVRILDENYNVIGSAN